VGSPPQRVVRLVLITPEGDLIGALPPFPVEVPWWPEAWPIVRGARERHGIEVTVLRLLEVDVPPGQTAGGHVTYVAETADPVPHAEPCDLVLDDHPLRQSWAHPGGPAAHVGWAVESLAARGITGSGPAEQVKTWNLSTLWRIPTADRTVWLKLVPPFLAHEGSMLERLRGERVPKLLAHDGARILLDSIPGEDLFGIGEPMLSRMVRILVALQSELSGDLEGLLSLGLPDWRAAALSSLIADVAERMRHEIAAEDARDLDTLVAGLERRSADIAACGVPETLVHGDFHPGNFRGDPGGNGSDLVLLDWGDSGVGHALLDQPAFLDRIDRSAVESARATWTAAWREVVPGSDPERAARLLAPVAAARQAVIYRKFLDSIEPSEHPYHRDDPQTWLRNAAELVRAERA
jgi:hypothetical protein